MGSRSGRKYKYIVHAYKVVAKAEILIEASSGKQARDKAHKMVKDEQIVIDQKSDCKFILLTYNNR